MAEDWNGYGDGATEAGEGRGAEGLSSIAKLEKSREMLTAEFTLRALSLSSRYKKPTKNRCFEVRFLNDNIENRIVIIDDDIIIAKRRDSYPTYSLPPPAHSTPATQHYTYISARAHTHIRTHVHVIYTYITI